MSRRDPNVQRALYDRHALRLGQCRAHHRDAIHGITVRLAQDVVVTVVITQEIGEEYSVEGRYDVGPEVCLMYGRPHLQDTVQIHVSQTGLPALHPHTAMLARQHLGLAQVHRTPGHQDGIYQVVYLVRLLQYTAEVIALHLFVLPVFVLQPARQCRQQLLHIHWLHRHLAQPSAAGLHTYLLQGGPCGQTLCNVSHEGHPDAIGLPTNKHEVSLLVGQASPSVGCVHLCIRQRLPRLGIHHPAGNGILTPYREGEDGENE